VTPLPDHRRLAVRSLLSLPAPVLRALSGGAAVHKAGRTLDPRLQFLSRHAARADAATPQSADEIREQQAATDRDLLGRVEPGVAVEPINVPGGGGDLQGRLYRTGAPARALLLWFPSGGGVVPGLIRDEPLCSMLAAIGGCEVAAVQPRLAPEHRFPAPLDDALAALEWGRRDAATRGLGGVAVGGAGLGASLAAAVCAVGGQPRPVLQVLVSPWLDLAGDQASIGLFADSWPVTAADIAWRAGQVLGADTDPAAPRVSPLRARDLGGLPPVVLVTGGFDPLADQGEAYARRLRGARVPVRYRRHDALANDFHVMTGAIPAADAACRETAALVREALEAQAAPTA
jgi:acetyl esterase/lipase